MQEERPIYVLDTNILVDYPDIIPGEDGKRPVDPTVDLDEAHVVIPSVVIRELSKFKKETTERGKAARTVLRRLRNLFEGNVRNPKDVYHLEAAISTLDGKQKISILPVHKDFHKTLVFDPAKDDMDGQVILTTLVVGCIMNSYPIDGTEGYHDSLCNTYNKGFCKNVVLLTNDNGLAIRARERGISTSRYGYKHYTPYTGRRDIVVPDEIFSEFWNARLVSRKMFEDLMPAETPKLIPNEFIVMQLADPNSYPSDYGINENPYFNHIGRYDLEKDAIVPLKFVGNFPICPRNAGQAIYAEALANPQFAAVVCAGPAGSGKTYMATVFGYDACKKGQFIGVTIVPCEGRSSIGALPGDLDEKMDPDVQPIKNAIRNYLINNDPKFSKEIENLRKFGTGKDAKKLRRNGDDDAQEEKGSIKSKLEDRVGMIWDNWFSNIPIESARGRDFSYELAIYDEAQDQTPSQMDTLIKRLGTDGKIIITGDIEQIHAPYLDHDNNGLVYARTTLLGSNLVAQVCFTEEEVIRHPLVKEVARRQCNAKTK